MRSRTSLRWILIVVSLFIFVLLFSSLAAGARPDFCERHPTHWKCQLPPPPPLAACADTIDNDNDGLIDYPADPGCSSSSDTEESNSMGDFNAPAPSGGDDTSALMSFFATVPDGTSTTPNNIIFQAGTYQIADHLLITSRNWLVFDLNGATIQWTTPDDDSLRLFYFLTSDHITIKNGTLLGTYTYPTSGSGLVDSLQHMHAIDFDRTTNGIVDNVDISSFYGDGVYIGTEGAAIRSTDIQVINSDIREVGRNAVSVVAANDVLVQDNHFQQIGYWGVDIEPNLGGLSCSRITVDGNTWGGQGGTTTRRIFGIVPHMAVDTVSFTNNSISGRDASIWINETGSETPFEQRVTNLTISGNTNDTTSAGFIWHILNTDDLTVGTNTIPVSSGSVISLRDVCNYSITGTSYLEVTPCSQVTPNNFQVVPPIIIG